MKRLIIAMSMALSLLATPAVGQWLNYKTPGIPRTRDVKPNLTAPAPRAADGKPDLSGMWAVGGLGHATNITDVEMVPEAQALHKKRLESYGAEDPAANCLPEGPRSGLDGLGPLRIIQTSYITTVLYETGQFRLIYTDGRPLPKR
jgi:hypothetical protein